jgi:hypothetical protein
VRYNFYECVWQRAFRIVEIVGSLLEYGRYPELPNGVWEIIPNKPRGELVNEKLEALPHTEGKSDLPHAKGKKLEAAE